MPSPRPVTGSVKIVKPTPDIHRKSLNAMEQTRVNITKSGALAKGTAKPIEAKNSGTKPTVVSVRSNPGITGAGARNVARLYRGGGIGMFGLPKNK